MNEVIVGALPRVTLRSTAHPTQLLPAPDAPFRAQADRAGASGHPDDFSSDVLSDARFRRADMLGADAYPEQPRRNAAQDGKKIK